MNNFTQLSLNFHVTKFRKFVNFPTSSCVLTSTDSGGTSGRGGLERDGFRAIVVTSLLCPTILSQLSHLRSPMRHGLQTLMRVAGLCHVPPQTRSMVKSTSRLLCRDLDVLHPVERHLRREELRIVFFAEFGHHYHLPHGARRTAAA